MALSTSLDDLTANTRDAWLALVEAARAEGIELRVRSTGRTCAEQNELYSIGRGDGDTRQIVTAARGCQSYHVMGRAVDFDAFPPKYDIVGALAKGIGFGWGGDFKPPAPFDPGHVQFTEGLTISAMCPNPSDCESVREAALAAKGTFSPRSSRGRLVKRAAAGLVLALTLGYVAFQAAKR
jgi:hypothetical protein